MEPWLDSLSEDWNSEPRSSSPASSNANRSKHGSHSSTKSQSRIPHLAQSLRKDSTRGSFLKPRSARGIAKANGLPVLSERSPSSLNLLPSASHIAFEKKQVSTLPRRPSSTFSDSQQSVQHHTINSASRTGEPPQWKKRLTSGDDIASDGLDLFSPSKLEGMFTQPADSRFDPENHSSVIESETKPWTSLKLGQLPRSTEQHKSFRTSRSRGPAMEALKEVNEEDEATETVSTHPLELRHSGRVSEFAHERNSNAELRQLPSDRASVQDPRWRTFSGQQEMRNELISPVTASATNTIRENAIRDKSDISAELLRKKLTEAGLDGVRRPSSRSSDRDVSYNRHVESEESLLHEEFLPDMTSQSLPEDLSMGTQDFVLQGGYINGRRGAPSNEVSLLRRKLSSSADHSYMEPTDRQSSRYYQSSPPQRNGPMSHEVGVNESATSIPSSPQDTSVVRHDPENHSRPVSAGSPLKLFGNRDTYTNNKLMRVLSQFEHADSHHIVEGNDDVSHQDPRAHSEAGFRMSQFGHGELDTFNFEKEVGRPTTMDELVSEESGTIFKDMAKLMSNDKPTTMMSNTLRPLEDTNNEDVAKRLPSSPAKDRTPKRRRTLLKDEILIEGIGVEVEVHQALDTSNIAGRKRKDAKPGEDGAQADPATLASRSILRPRVASRKSSSATQIRSTSAKSTNLNSGPSSALTEALAAELASFAQGVSEANQDSRKASLATKDYMEEANKVMEFIRARGKPKPQLPEIPEPLDVSELHSEDTVGFDVDDEDSTKDSFSRPPSREHSARPREDRRHAKHDPRVASHLKKFQELDELELLASTSVMGTLNLVDHQMADEAALVPVPEDEQESSPPNMRLLNHDEKLRKRKHSESTNPGQHSLSDSSQSASRRTFATESSNSSGQKGIITCGTVSIPDRVGTMSFDHEKQIWVKQQLAKTLLQASEDKPTVVSMHARENTLDDDPFESIPDLSIDEQREEAMRVIPKSSSQLRQIEKVQADQRMLDLENTGVQQLHDQILALKIEDCGQSSSSYRADTQPHKDQHDADALASKEPSRAQDSPRSEASGHEQRLHDGIPSELPGLHGSPTRQPRVVTIAFSSPVACAIPCQPPLSVSDADLDDDDDNFLPPDDLDTEDEVPPSTKATDMLPSTQPVLSARSVSGPITRHEQYRSMTLNRRPVSRIDEHDDESVNEEGLSLVHVKEPVNLTPRPNNQLAGVSRASAHKGSSILCLTPLSEFTMHQADQVNHPEESFVAARPHHKALLHSHGSLALAVDNMVKAITDAVPSEPFWEQVRGLDLKGKQLTGLHGMDDYCPVLEKLIVSDNLVSQLNGLPPTLRQLDISVNRVNSFTSWGHLRNLQYVDVSDNQLENLEGFGSLVHIRTLKACNNQIKDISGILDLDGLICLELGGNRLTKIDFEGTELNHLQVLDISNNQLTSIRNLQQLPSLEKLRLDKNKLMEVFVPTSIKKLTELSIAHNEIESLDLARFPALEELNVDGNNLRAIQGLSTAGCLRRLSARDQLGSDSIINNILLTKNECYEILLSSNVLDQGQLELPAYPHYNLRNLELAGCGLRTLPSGFGDYFPNCRTLNLNFNAVQNLSPLMGCIKLQQLMLAGNRIDRLRRTCLTLSRLPVLQHLDLRDNPLTVGFYAPKHDVDRGISDNVLPARSAKQDVKWLQTLDETTSLRRRTIELLLAERCKHLVELDGSTFHARDILKPDRQWTALTSKGILLKALEMPPPGAIELATSARHEDQEGRLPILHDDQIVSDATTRERSLQIE